MSDRPDNRRRGLAPSAYRKLVALLILLLPVLLVGFVVLTFATKPAEQGRELRFDEFAKAVQDGRIQNAVLYDRDSRILGQSADGPYWVSLPANNPSSTAAVVDRLTQAKVPTEINSQFVKSLIGPYQVLVPSLMIIDVFLLILLFTQRPSITTGGIGKADAGRLAAGAGTASFADVAGLDEAVAELQEVRDYLSEPERFLALGARIPRGILLQGPPGCGKTLLARAVAGEANVPFFSISGASFVELYVGVGAARIRDLFEEARAAAPAIVFIDEIDAVGRTRGASATAAASGGERETTLNQLLVALDGFDPRSGIVVLGATNRPDMLDPALMRPGRFDRTVPIDPPDFRGRLAILKVHGKGKPLAADVDLERVARRTPGFNGADLANLVNEAALLSVRRSATQIGNAAMEEAIERVLVGAERRSRVMDEADKKIAAYHEAGHAVAAHFLLPGEQVYKVSVVARGRSMGSTTLVTDGENRLASRDDLLDRIAVALAGRVAEETGLGQASGAAQDDLKVATRIARQMIFELGMGEEVGLLSLATELADLASGDLARPYSEELAATADREVQKILAEGRLRSERVITANRKSLDRIARLLIDEETVEQEVLADMLTPAARKRPA